MCGYSSVFLLQYGGVGGWRVKSGEACSLSVIQSEGGRIGTDFLDRI